MIENVLLLLNGAYFAVAYKAGIPRRRHRHGHPREDVGEDVGVGVGVVECQLNGNMTA